MKKKLMPIMAILALIFSMPAIVSAQTAEEGWITLKEAMQNKYSARSHEGIPTLEGLITVYNLEPTNDKVANDVFIKKIAFKENVKVPYSDHTTLVIEKVDGLEGDKLITSNPVSVSPKFEIKIDGKKVNKKQIKENGQGLKVFEFDDLQRIAYVGSFLEDPQSFERQKLRGENKTNINSYFDYPIFSNIYVVVEDGSSYANAAEEAHKKAQEELFATTVFKSPQQSGWTPTSSETLADGTVVEHYSQGVRTYKKPNGDYATFIEMDDIRDPKTLDLISGTTLPVDSASYPIGAFRITQPNGLILESDGIFSDIIFTDHGKLKIREESKDIYYSNYKDLVKSVLNELENNESKIKYSQYDILKNKSQKSAGKFNSNNDKIAFYPFFDISYSDFIDPQDNIILGRLGPEDPGYNGSWPQKRSMWAFPYEYIDKEGNKTGYDELSFVEYNGIQKIFCYKNLTILGLSGDDMMWEGIATAYDTSELQANRRVYTEDNFIFFNTNKITNISADNIVPGSDVLYITEIDYENGDKLKIKYDASEGVVDDGTILTLPNGTKIEEIEGKWRIIHPDGSRYIGTLPHHSFSNRYSEIEPVSISFYNTYKNSGEFKYGDGVLTKADGTENHYVNSINQEEAQLAAAEREKREYERLQAKYNEFVKKYGKANVDNALKATATVGMPIQLLVDFNLATYYNDNDTYSWYKLFVGVGWRKDIFKENSSYMVTRYRLLKVNKSTGKIVYVGPVEN